MEFRGRMFPKVLVDILTQKPQTTMEMLSDGKMRLNRNWMHTEKWEIVTLCSPLKSILRYINARLTLIIRGGNYEFVR